jgi:hypothetical protein
MPGPIFQQPHIIEHIRRKALEREARKRANTGRIITEQERAEKRRRNERFRRAKKEREDQQPR